MVGNWFSSEIVGFMKGSDLYLVKRSGEITSSFLYLHSDATETVITGLKPFSKYDFSVRAHESEKVFFAFSPPVQATTMENRK